MTVNDSFLNCGLPQYNANSNLTENDIQTIKNQLNDFSAYYGNSFLNSDSYKMLKNYVNNYCVACRWYSLIIE